MKTLLIALLVALSFTAHAGLPQDSSVKITMKLSTAAYVYSQVGDLDVKVSIATAAKDTNNRSRMVTVTVKQSELVQAGWQLRNSPEGPTSEANAELLSIIQSLLPNHPYLLSEFISIRATNQQDYENLVLRGLSAMWGVQDSKAKNE